MRLKQSEIDGILKGLSESKDLKPLYELYLFGSRTNDRKRGGDIDLLLVVLQEQVGRLSAVKYKLVAQAKKYIPDQRLDLTIKAKELLNHDPLFASISDQLILLN